MIFNLFKTKPEIKELIPKGFVDIHSHILPGIDDGAKNINESLELVSGMKNLGFSKVIATPHIYPGLYENNITSIMNSYNKISKKINDQIQINYAAEYMLENGLINKIRENKLLCLKEKYVLTEMSFLNEPINLKEIIFELKTNNYVPILAHPERYLYYRNNKKIFLELKKIGFKFQMNLLSVTGYYGKEVLKMSSFLLKNNLIDFVGTDIHNLIHINLMKNKVRIVQKKKIEEAIQNNNFFK